MMSPSSLAGRLVVHLLGGLLLIYVLTILWLQFGFTVSSASELQWDDFSQLGTHILVADSVVRSQDGSIRIDPTAGLRAEIERTPTLRYAAFDPDTGLVALGSSADPAAALGHENGIEALKAIFRLRDGKDKKQKFFLGLRDTPARKLAMCMLVLILISLDVATFHCYRLFLLFRFLFLLRGVCFLCQIIVPLLCGAIRVFIQTRSRL